MYKMTVRELKEKLSAFPDDALCYPYEGECMAVVVTGPREKDPEYGAIHFKTTRRFTAGEVEVNEEAIAKHKASVS
jgi:hypothetical protein